MNDCIRKITTEEKRNIGLALFKLSAEDLQKVVGIVGQADPSFQSRAEEVHIEMDVLVNLLLKHQSFVLSGEKMGLFFFLASFLVCRTNQHYGG